jgi:hypothetical protein
MVAVIGLISITFLLPFPHNRMLFLRRSGLTNYPKTRRIEVPENKAVTGLLKRPSLFQLLKPLDRYGPLQTALSASIVSGFPHLGERSTSGSKIYLTHLQRNSYPFDNL